MNIEGHSVEEGSLPGNTFAASALYSGSRKNAVTLGPFTPRTLLQRRPLLSLAADRIQFKNSVLLVAFGHWEGPGSVEW